MSSEDDVLLQMYAKAPPPVRDYYGIIISNDHVVLNIWNISHGPHVYPKKYKKHVSEFLDDKELQYHIGNTFGTHVRDFVIGLAQKEYNLQYLPTKLFLKVLKLLAARDIYYLSQTSKIFFELCNTENVWKIVCHKKMKRSLTTQELIKAEEVGWKQLIKNKMEERKKMKCKTVPIKNNNKKLNEKNGVKIDFIRNVKTNLMAEKPKNCDVNKNQQKTSARIDGKRNNLKPNVILENVRNATINISNCKTDTNRSKIIEKGPAKSGFPRNVKSTVMLENKKISEKKIHSVTDVINAISSSTRIKSSNVNRNQMRNK